MTHLSEIWKCLLSNLPRKQWVGLQAIYKVVEKHIHLDAEDFELNRH